MLVHRKEAAQRPAWLPSKQTGQEHASPRSLLRRGFQVLTGESRTGAQVTRARLRCRILMQNRSVDCHCHFYSALGLGTRRGLTTLVREESKATYQPGRSQEQKQPRRSWCAKDLPPGRFWTTRTCPCQGFAQHTRTARRFSMSLHTRKGPQPNRFLPVGNATWGTVKCPSGRVGRARKYGARAS